MLVLETLWSRLHRVVFLLQTIHYQRALLKGRKKKHVKHVHLNIVI